MKIIKFKVVDQSLTLLTKDTIIKGSKGYLKCQFDFLNEYLSLFQKVAKFQYRDKTEFMPIIDNECYIPDSMTDYPVIKVSLIMKNGDKLIPTDEVYIRQEVVLCN